MSEISYIFAFTAGIISFLSPCVLPLLPGFLAYLASHSTKDLQSGKATRWGTFLASVFFVLGFSVVFAALGILLNTVLSHVAYSLQTWLSRIGGTIIILFGMYLAGLLKFQFLERDYRINVQRTLSSTHLTSFVFGAAFAVGWTPCVGAVLGAILGLAASQPGSAFGLLLTYSLGLGLPFLAVGLFAGTATALIRRYTKYLNYVAVIFGFVLIALGVLVFTQSLSMIASFELINRLIL